MCDLTVLILPRGPACLQLGKVADTLDRVFLRSFLRGERTVHDALHANFTYGFGTHGDP